MSQNSFAHHCLPSTAKCQAFSNSKYLLNETNMMTIISQDYGENKIRIHENCINSYNSHNHAVRQNLLLSPLTYEKTEVERG